MDEVRNLGFLEIDLDAYDPERFPVFLPLSQENPGVNTAPVVVRKTRSFNPASNQGMDFGMEILRLVIVSVRALKDKGVTSGKVIFWFKQRTDRLDVCIECDSFLLAGENHD